MKKSKAIFALISVGFIFFSASANAEIASVGDPGKTWEVPNDDQRGQQIFSLIDNPFGGEDSFLVKSSYSPGVDKEDPTCVSTEDPKCAEIGFSYRALLPRCSDTVDVNCIMDFGTVDASGQRTSGVYQRNYPAKALNEFKGNPAINVPNGTTGSIYKLSGAPFVGGNDYYVAVEMTGGGNSKSASKTSFSAYVYPVVENKSIAFNPWWVDSGVAKITQAGAGHDVGTYVTQSFGLSQGTSCFKISVQDKSCLERYAFPADTRYFLDVRLSQDPDGWLHGRMGTPDISIKKVGKYSEISIVANPIAVPAVYKMYEWANMPAELKANYDTVTGGYIPDREVYVAGSGCGRSACDPEPAKRNKIVSPAAYTESAAAQLLLYLPYLNDKAQAMYGTWSLRTLSKDEASGANKCFVDGTGVTGIVTTNSTTYSAGPPQFNKAEGTLNYKVAAPHYTSKGDVFAGNYDLVIRSDVARCVYGFSNAPVAATVSVTSSDGKTSIASTVLSEKNGWISLAAKGFTFSSPVVTVKLTQEAPVVVPVPVETKAPVVITPTKAPVAKKITITCVKGKTTKKVTAIKPACPKGYKRK